MIEGMPIKSPFMSNTNLEQKLKDLFDSSDVEACLVFYVPTGGNLCLLENGMCGHDLLQMSKELKERGEQRLKEGEGCSPINEE